MCFLDNVREINHEPMIMECILEQVRVLHESEEDASIIHKIVNLVPDSHLKDMMQDLTKILMTEPSLMLKIGAVLGTSSSPCGDSWHSIAKRKILTVSSLLS
jgi:hypothetical protein